MKSNSISMTSGNSAAMTGALAANRIDIVQSLVITNYDFENNNAAQIDVYVRNFYAYTQHDEHDTTVRMININKISPDWAPDSYHLRIL